jgi:hypothetical protein
LKEVLDIDCSRSNPVGQHSDHNKFEEPHILCKINRWNQEVTLTWNSDTGLLSENYYEYFMIDGFPCPSRSLCQMASHRKSIKETREWEPVMKIIVI